MVTLHCVSHLPAQELRPLFLGVFVVFSGDDLLCICLHALVCLTCTLSVFSFPQDMQVFKVSCQSMVAKTEQLEARAEQAEAQNMELLDFVEVRAALICPL